MSGEVWAEFQLEEAQNEMKRGHSRYLSGISTLIVVLISFGVLVAYTLSAVTGALTNPQAAATVNLGWVPSACVLLVVLGLLGLVLLYFGIHDFMRATRKAMDWLVTRRNGSGAGEDLPPPLSENGKRPTR